MTSKLGEHDSTEQCVRLQEFKRFLQDQVGGDSSGNVSGAELRTCVTRSSSETYPVSAQEVRAEVIMAVWNHLQTKRCPQHFQLPLLRAVVTAVERECHNSKECEFSCVPAKCAAADKGSAANTQYDLVKLQKFVLNNFEKLLTRLTDNAEESKLQNYAEPAALCDGVNCQCSVAITPTPAVGYVAGHIKNKHRKMEDRHVCLERYSELYEIKQSYSFYGVFDGHSGPLAASYVSSQLPLLLAEQLKSSNDINDVNSYREAFEACFMEADKMFKQKCISSGTTAVCVLHAPHSSEQPGQLFVAWVGDSKALLVSPTTSLQLVKPHKPDTPEERKRIESSDTGGTVMHVQGQWRVNGILNVSRSIGDYSVPAVIAEPDFVDVPLTSAHDFLVLGTDGLFDHVSEAKIVESIYAVLNNPEQRVEDIPKLLIELAKQGDSQDNITIVVVFFKERALITANHNKV